MKIFSISFQFIFQHLAKRFLLCFIFSFFTFVLFDYAILLFKQVDMGLLRHYIATFFYRYELFAIISGIFATCNTLYTLSRNNEILALQVAGIPLSKCIRPFILLGIFLAFSGYMINEFAIPSTYKWIKKKNFRIHVKNNTPFVHEYLNDGSHIAYLISDKKIIDFYWIRSNENIWHATSIEKEDSNLAGNFVDHFEKAIDGKFVKTESYDTYYFPPLLNYIQGSINVKPVMPLKDYLGIFFTSTQVDSKDLAPILTQFFHKIAGPWFPLLTIAMAFLLFFRFNFRERPVWLCFSAAIIFLCFFSLSKTFIILGENYMLAPWIPFLALPVMAYLYIGWRITKLA